MIDAGMTYSGYARSGFFQLLWVGIAFIIVMIRIAGYRTAQAWLTPVLLASGLVTLLGLNLANPEAIIASTNITFDEDPGLSYQHVLTADGIVILADRIEEVPESERAETIDRMCARQGEFPDRGLLAFNLSQRRAHEALKRLCP